jgi:hypothetical protein
MKINKKRFWIFDNEGKTFDRYTIILQNGDILGASFNPFDPQGFGQYCSNCINDFLLKKYKDYYVQISKKEKNKIVNNFIKEAQKNPDLLGKEITEISDLPNEIVKFITQNL